MMRQLRALVERGWEIKANMRTNGLFFISVTHDKWGEAQGVNRNLNEAIKEMFSKTKELEKVWSK